VTLHARQLDRTVTIERLSRTVDDYGAEAEAWAPVATLRAQRVENGSREFVRAYGQAEEGTAVFRTRFASGITTADRLVFEGDALELVEVREIGRRASLELRTRTLKVAP
jgi:SPP1 family predicted phage head-tail adaptor